MSDSVSVECVTRQLITATVNEKVELSFAGRGLKLDTANDAKEIVDAIVKCSGLNILELKGNTLGIEAAGAIGSALGNHKTFSRALWSDLFTGRMKTEIPDALKLLCGGILKAQACLVELDLSDNAFGPNGMKGLVDFLRSSSCYTLQELRLNNNGLGIQGGQMLADSLQYCYEASVKAGTPLALKVFVSGRGRLEDEGATQLSKVFKAMKSLEEVHMPQNGINHKGISALAEAFSVNHGLRHINLSDNTFTERGSKAMAAAFPHLTQLEIVNFDDCLMRTEGVKCLSAAMKSANHNLKILKLSGNEINGEGAEEIVKVACTMSLLEELDLNANQLGEEGVQMVRRVMNASGKCSQLASLSDDEGTDDENEDHDGNDDDDADDDDEENNSDNDDEVAKVKGGTRHEREGKPEENIKNDVNAVVKKLDEMMVNSGQKTSLAYHDRNEVSTYEAQEKCLKDFMKLTAHVREKEEESLPTSVLKEADEILCGLFNSTSSESIGVVANILLVYLGLIKDEDRKYHTPDNLEGALVVLNHAVQQNYFPSSAKHLLASFVDKSADKLSGCLSAREKLLKTLTSE